MALLHCRPGIDLSKEPPAVRMNEELGGILTYKLKVCPVIAQTSNMPHHATLVITRGFISRYLLRQIFMPASSVLKPFSVAFAVLLYTPFQLQNLVMPKYVAARKGTLLKSTPGG